MNAAASGDLPLVIGVGNPMRGDDGIGAAVIAELARRGVAADLAESDGEAARLIDMWDGRHHVMVIDACCSGDAVGTVMTRDVASAPRGGSAASSHGVGVAHAVELAAVLGRLPESLVLITIEGATFEIGAPLSPAVAAAVPIAAAHVAAAFAASGQCSSQ